MDPLTLYAFVSAMMSAISVWQQERAYKLAREEFDRKYKLALESPELAQQARQFAALVPQRTYDLLEKRVQRCWEEFDKKIDPDRGSGVDRQLAESEVRECLCGELRTLYRLNGSIPQGPFRDWWNQYACGPVII
jgi:hypothetical protein